MENSCNKGPGASLVFLQAHRAAQHECPAFSLLPSWRLFLQLPASAQPRHTILKDRARATRSNLKLQI
eukprot:2472541-Amphidinium_carterae.1